MSQFAGTFRFLFRNFKAKILRDYCCSIVIYFFIYIGHYSIFQQSLNHIRDWQLKHIYVIFHLYVCWDAYSFLFLWFLRLWPSQFLLKCI